MYRLSSDFEIERVRRRGGHGVVIMWGGAGGLLVFRLPKASCESESTVAPSSRDPTNVY